jgi:flagellar motility protein MotE (MotC chaperone)
MKTLRVLVVVTAASVVLKCIGLGALWHDAAGTATEAVAATPSAAENVAAVETDGTACGEESRGFHDLLASVRRRAEEVGQREADLKTREASLQALRRATAAEVTRLEDVAKTLGITGQSGTGVVMPKVYESMRPEDAAPILDRLDDTTLRALLGRMHEKQVGAILAAMSRERAVAVTKLLAAPVVAAPAAAPTH